MARQLSPGEKPLVKIGFTAFHGGFDLQHNPITDLLRRRFEVQVCDEPDFMFCADFWYGAHRFDLNKMDCVRIGYTGENDNADFSSYDYYIGFEHIGYPDRYFRCPNLLFDCDLSDWQPLEDVAAFAASKTRFCNFCFSHPSESGAREAMVRLLSDYKTVDCFGPFLNNTPEGPRRISRAEKAEVVAASRFTICCESTSRPGFVTEKIWEAFKNHSVPIYYGDETVTAIFNPKAFVNMHDFASFEEAAAFVKRLDADEEAYRAMLAQPPFAEGFDYAAFLDSFEAFLAHIVRQEPKAALRRPTCFMPAGMNDYFALLKPYAQRLDRAEKRATRWRQRRYWGLRLLRRFAPGLVPEPDAEMLNFYYKRHERAVKKE